MVPPQIIRQINLISGQTVIEDRVSSMIQGFGFLLALGGVPLLIVMASLYGDAASIVGVSVYGATLIILYAASSLYHGIQHEGIKRVLKVLDHSAIYLLIAGTYTPLTLVPLRGAWGWSLFGVVWGLAAMGILGKITGVLSSNRRALPLYLLAGWVCLVAVVPMASRMPTGGLLLVLIGGAIYSLGVVFFVLERIPFNTAIWHLFVMGGAISHYFAILFYTIPIPS